MIIGPEKITPGDIIKLAEYDPLKKIGYVKFYKTLDDLIENPFTRYVNDPLNPSQYLYTLVVDVDIHPHFRGLRKEIRAIRILYKTQVLWTAIENVIIL